MKPFRGAQHDGSSWKDGIDAAASGDVIALSNRMIWGKPNKGVLRKLSDKTEKLVKPVGAAETHLNNFGVVDGCDWAAFSKDIIKPILQDCYTSQAEVALLQILKDESLDDKQKASDLETELALVASNLESTDTVLPLVYDAATKLVGMHS